EHESACIRARVACIRTRVAAHATPPPFSTRAIGLTWHGLDPAPHPFQAATCVRTRITTPSRAPALVRALSWSPHACIRARIALAFSGRSAGGGAGGGRALVSEDESLLLDARRFSGLEWPCYADL